MSKNIFQIGNGDLTFEDIEHIINENQKLELSPAAKERIQKCRDYLDIVQPQHLTGRTQHLAGESGKKPRMQCRSGNASCHCKTHVPIESTHLIIRT